MNKIIEHILKLQGAIEMFRKLESHQFDLIQISLPPLIFPVESLLNGIEDISSRLRDLSDQSLSSSIRELNKKQLSALEIIYKEIVDDKDGNHDDFEWWEALQLKLLKILDKVDNSVKGVIDTD